MAQQTVNIGSSANDVTGDPLRTAFDKINDNFTELYTASTVSHDITLSGNKISTGSSNANLKLEASGTGVIELEGIQIRDNNIEGTRSNEDLFIDASGTGTINLTNLKLATGATVTGILDEDNLGTDSATQLATQQSIKAYVDSQVTAQDLDFACDDSTTLSIDLDSESLQFSGGTGITTAGTLNTVTVAIDSTVATLTGSQTLTNKTLTTPIVSGGTFTGTTEIDNLNFNDNIISSDSNADISIQPGGTGSVIASGLSFSGTTISAPDSSTVNINEGLNVDGTVTVEGTTNTADVVTTGATTISGALTAGSLNIGDLNISADGSITSDTNGDIVIDPAGTGEIVLTGTVTHAGTQTTTGQLNVDNLRLDGNTFSATSGGITITPATGQNVAVGGTGTKLTATEAQFTLMEAGTVRADVIQNDTSDGNITISAQGTGVVSISPQLTLTGSFLPAIHTFAATDSITITEHAGRTLLLGEVGGNALVTLTLPDATGSGAVYKFIVSVTNTSNYVIKVPDADNTIDGIMLYLDEDGTAVTAFPTVAASDTITLNGGTTGGIIGDYLEIVDIAADQYHVRGVMRVAAGANPSTPFSATVS